MNVKGVWNMSKKGIVRNISLMLAAVLGTVNFGGCGEEASSDRAEVEMVCYKPEAVKAFEKMEARFNEVSTASSKIALSLTPLIIKP